MKRTPEQLLALAKQLKIKDITLASNEVLESLSEGISPWEALVWSELRKEALEVKAGLPVGPYMSSELGSKYTTGADLADAIIGNSNALMQARGYVIKTRQSKITHVESLTTIDDVNASTNW